MYFAVLAKINKNKSILRSCAGVQVGDIISLDDIIIIIIL